VKFFSSTRTMCALLFALALAFRVVGLHWGLPTAERWYSLHPDEWQIFGAVVSLDFFSGDFNPDFYNYPSLFIYVTYVLHFLGGMFGFFAAPSQEFWRPMADIMLTARVASAFFGAATAPLVYLTARHVLRGKTAPALAILAGGLMALAPGHVQHSHFATVDVASTFFIALSLWLTARAFSIAPAKAQRSLLFAAIAAGLAAATKYNAGLVVIAPVIAAWLLSRPGTTSAAIAPTQTSAKADTSPTGVSAPLSFAKTVPALIGLTVLAFIIGCPGSLLYFRDFWGDGQNTGVSYELLVHPRQGSGEIFQDTGNGWLYHLLFNLPFAFSAPLLILTVTGAVFLARTKAKVGVPLLVFAGLYFFSLGFSQVRFMRYVLPLIPLLCIFAASAVAPLAERKLMAGRIAAVVVLLVGALSAFDVLAPFTGTDPRDAAATWMKANTPSEGTSIALVERPWFWTPPYSHLDARPGSDPRLLPQALAANSRYRLVMTGFDAAALSAEKPDYVSLSEFEWRDKARLADASYLQFRQALQRDYEVIQTFKPKQTLGLPGRDFVPHDFLYNHPEVQLYKRK
jgi:hypothetical protein